MNSVSRGSRLLLLAISVVLALAFASEANAGIYVSKTPTSFLRVTMNEQREPVRIEGVFEFDCDGTSHGTTRIQLTGPEIRRYKDGSFGFRTVSSVFYDSRRKLRARLKNGRVQGFFSYRSFDEYPCWTGKGPKRSTVRFSAKRRTLNPSTYVVQDPGLTLRITLTEVGRPIRLEGTYPIRCGPDSPVVDTHIEGFLPEHFKSFADGSFGMGPPLTDNSNGLLQGLRAKLVDGKVVGSLWYRFRVSPSPTEQYSCYSGESDGNPVVEFEATRPDSTPDGLQRSERTADRSGPIRYDKTFGSDGFARYPDGLRAEGDSVAKAPRGKLVVGIRQDSSVIRYTARGRLDKSFGDRGIAGLRFGTRKVSQSDVIVDRRGRVVVGGSARRDGKDGYRAAITRLLPDGSHDRSFGAAGLTLPDRLRSAEITSMTFARGGSIVAAGELDSDPEEGLRFIVRLGPDGRLDKSFGTKGTRVLRFGETWSNTVVAMDPRGRIVLGTSSTNRPQKEDKWVYSVVRLNQDGSPDDSFSGDGRAVINPTRVGRDSLGDLTIDRAGRIVVVGWGRKSSAVRLLPNGRLDRSFADGGRRVIQVRSYPTVAVDNRGRIIIVGGDPGVYDIGTMALVERLLPNGKDDPSVTKCQGFCTHDVYSFSDLVIDDRNRIVLATVSSEAGLVRLLNR